MSSCRCRRSPQMTTTAASRSCWPPTSTSSTRRSMHTGRTIPSNTFEEIQGIPKEHVLSFRQEACPHWWREQKSPLSMCTSITLGSELLSLLFPSRRWTCCCSVGTSSMRTTHPGRREEVPGPLAAVHAVHLRPSHQLCSLSEEGP